jgi:riboflavin synthase
MFTGLVEEVATVVGLRTTRRGTQLQIAAPIISADTPIGASVAVNGCCLTVTGHEHQQLAFDLLNETLERTNLLHLSADHRVNLERALRATDRFGGHFMQGHVDCAAHIVAFDQHDADYRLELELPRQFAQYVVAKGSIAVDGISLTVAEVLPQSFAVWIIPYTRAHTNLQYARVGDLVNLEFDLLAKYVERLLQYRTERALKSHSSRQRTHSMVDRS